MTTSYLGILKEKLATLEAEEEEGQHPHQFPSTIPANGGLLFGATATDAYHYRPPPTTNPPTPYEKYISSRQHQRQACQQSPPTCQEGDGPTAAGHYLNTTTVGKDEGEGETEGCGGGGGVIAPLLYDDELDVVRREHRKWKLQEAQLEDRYADASGYIRTKTQELNTLLTRWGVSVGDGTYVPVVVPIIHRPVRGAQPPSLWLRAPHGPSLNHSSPAQTRQIATCTDIQGFLELERLKGEIGYWRFLDTTITTTLEPEERRLRAEIGTVCNIQREARSILVLLWDAVWTRVASIVQSEQQQIDLRLVKIPSAEKAVGKASADASRVVAREVEKRVLYTLQLNHYRTLDTLQLEASPPSRGSTATTGGGGGGGGLPIVRIGSGVDDSDISLYPLTSAISAGSLWTLIQLAGETVWLRKVLDTAELDHDSEGEECSTELEYNTLGQMGLSATLHLRDALVRRSGGGSLRNCGSGESSPFTNQQSIAAIPDVSVHLQSIRREVYAVIAALQVPPG